jgi:5-methylcytosine-specific restriction endonuclease McrA
MSVVLVLNSDYGRRCGYCGGAASTIDHVLPRSRGGANTWENTVAACGRCNGRKGNRTPAEARMPLRRAPWRPSWAALT